MQKSLEKTSSYHLIKIGLLANAFEWYEFSVFNYLSVFIGKIFFQSALPIHELLKVFSLFTISYFIRPIGSIFFGLLGDRYGRRDSLKLSLILMTVPTIFIGFLPQSQSFSVHTTYALIFLRMVQGFAMGGELPATACYIFEASPIRHRSFLCAVVGTAPKIGLLLGSLVTYLLIYFFDENSLLDWGWRIPFWLGIPLTLFIAYTRGSIQETMDTQHVRPFTWKNFTNILPTLIKTLQIASFLNVGFPIVAIWMPCYLNHFLKLSLQDANFLNTLTLCFMVPVCLLSGFFAQFFGYRKPLIASILMTFFFVIPLFKFLVAYATGSLLIFIPLCLLAILTGIGQGLFVEIFNDAFPIHMRSLGVSLTCTLPAAFIGGTIPLVCSYVISQTGWLMFPAVYIVISCLFALPAAFTLQPYREKICRT